MKKCSLKEMIDEMMTRPAAVCGITDKMEWCFFTEDEVPADRPLYAPSADDEPGTPTEADVYHYFRLIGPVRGHGERLAPAGPTSYDDENLRSWLDTGKAEGLAEVSAVRRALLHAVRRQMVALCSAVTAARSDRPLDADTAKWWNEVLADAVISGGIRSAEELRAAAEDFIAKVEAEA